MSVLRRKFEILITWPQRCLAASRLLVFLFTLSSVGCVSPYAFRGIPVQNSEGVVLTLPPLLQTKQVSCGPTCVASVATFWELDFEAKFAPGGDFLVEEDFTAIELGRLGEGVGLAQFVYRGSLEDARDNLDKGRPIIALIERPNYANYSWLHLNNVPVTTIWNELRPKKSHWVVIVGMVPGKVILHDPAAGMVALPRGKFETLWQAKKNTCLLLVPRPKQPSGR